MHAFVLAVIFAYSWSVPCQVSDLRRFPSSSTIDQQRAVYVARAAYLENQQAFHPREYWDWQEAKGELECWHLVWTELHEARSGSGFSAEYTLDHLRRLRALIGEANYAAGQMPFYGAE